MHNQVSASAQMMAAGNIMAAAIASDPDVVEDLFGISRTMTRQDGRTRRDARIEAVQELVREMVQRIEAGPIVQDQHTHPHHHHPKK